MKRFVELYRRLDSTTSTGGKVQALADYFADADPADAAWALHFLVGRRFKRSITYTQLRRWAAAFAGLPDWLVTACHEAVGDMSETVTLLLPQRDEHSGEPLRTVVEQRIRPLASMTEDQRREALIDVWRTFSTDERFLYHKLVSGSFRVGVQRRIVVRALAQIAPADAEGRRADAATIEHRLSGSWQPTPELIHRLLAPVSDERDSRQPFPFFLASPLEDSPHELGEPADWLAEWKWDGIRAQLIRRGDAVALWARGEELIGDAFPEIVAVAHASPPTRSFVLDGELLAWADDAPLAFAMLQRRLNRKRVEPMLFPDVPVAFLAYDLLEHNGNDLREAPLSTRLDELDALLDALRSVNNSVLLPSPRLAFNTWHELAPLRDTARDRGVEGLMLKRLASPYRVGRVRGDWWKWKVDPLTIDAVMVGAQAGSGRRAGLYTDYTFAVWDDAGNLTPIAKAYSGLTDDEIRRVDAFIRTNTSGRSGPYRRVEPELVVELAFDAINESDRHKAGLALRFPRINRLRDDKRPADADTLANVRRLWQRYNAQR